MTKRRSGSRDELPHDPPGAASPLLTTVRGLLVGMRPRQWSKNLIVLVALIFAREFRDPSSVLLAVAGAALFTLASGGVYLLNDVADADRDRFHPDKRTRPVAAGIVAPWAAIVAGAAALAVAVGLGALLAWPLGAALGGYVVLQLAYSAVLKHLVVIDLLAIATGFVIRAAAGALVIGVAISPWLYLCAFLLALFLGVNKRWAEVAASDDQRGQRPVLEHYRVDFLRSVAVITTASVLMAYALYTFSASNLPPNHSMMLTIPVVLYGLLRYLYLVHADGRGEAPEQLLFRDPGILGAGVLWGALSIALLQFGG